MSPILILFSGLNSLCPFSDCPFLTLSPFLTSGPLRPRPYASRGLVALTTEIRGPPTGGSAATYGEPLPAVDPGLCPGTTSLHEDPDCPSVFGNTRVTHARSALGSRRLPEDISIVVVQWNAEATEI